MAVRIASAQITSNYTWNDIKDFTSWNTIRNFNASWQTIMQTAETGKSLRIEIDVTEGNWSSVNELLASWGTVKEKFNTWTGLKNW